MQQRKAAAFFRARAAAALCRAIGGGTPLAVAERETKLSRTQWEAPMRTHSIAITSAIFGFFALVDSAHAQSDVATQAAEFGCKLFNEANKANPWDVATEAGGIYVASNVADRASMEKLALSLTGDNEKAKKLAPTFLKVVKSKTWRGGSLIVTAASGAYAIYEYLGDRTNDRLTSTICIRPFATVSPDGTSKQIDK
jgi:hypothetical protein